MGRARELLKWVGKTVAGSLLGEAVSWKIVAVWWGAIWAAASAVLLPVLRGKYQTSGWWLAIIVGYITAVTAVAAMLGYQSRKRRRRTTFGTVIVEDRDYELEWHLRDHPINWAHLDLWGMTPVAMQQ